MTILGIDPGIGRTGWGLISEEKGRFKSVDYGCIETYPKDTEIDRLAQLYEQIEKLFKKHSPDEVVIEELFFNTNQKTALSVGQARGVVLLSCAQNKKNPHVYTPLQVKMSIAGYGRAQKSQIAHMVKSLLNLKKTPKPDDVTDALAVALTYAFSKRMTNRLSSR